MAPSLDRDLFHERQDGDPGADEALDLMFMDGLSTIAVVTETSGRGIGLAAVRADRDG
jgi:chemotaxis protein histidine kinase CheA